MIEVLSNLKLIFFILFFLILYILEFYFSNREWESRRLSRLLFHSLIAIINTILMRIPSLFLTKHRTLQILFETALETLFLQRFL